MIWVLLEITLPLCLAFLSGLGAGWLFWRWRRRSITQSDWDAQGKTNTIDALKLTTFEEESSDFKHRNTQLEATVEKLQVELNEAEKQKQSVSDELYSASQKLAALEAEDISVKPAALQDTSELDQKFQQAINHEIQQTKKIKELNAKTSNLQNTVDQQSNELQQSKQQTQKLTTDLKTANEQLALQKSTVSEEEFQELTSTLSQVKTEKTEIEQKLQEASSDVTLQKNNATELKSNVARLESVIENQTDELLKENQNAEKLNVEIETLRSQLTESSTSNEDELQVLQSKLDAEKSRAEQQLIDKSGEISQQNNRINELQIAIEKLEATVQTQSSELQVSSARAEQQITLSNELQQKLKQSETVTTERDTAIAKIKQLEIELSDAGLKIQELDQTKSQLNDINQKFRNLQSSVVANRQTREEQTTKLHTHIEKLQTALDGERKKLTDYGSDKQNLQQLEQVSKNKKELSDAQTKLAEVTTQLNNALARNNQLAAKTNTVSTPTLVTPISVGQINRLKSTLGEKEKRIEELERKLKTSSTKQKNATRKSKNSWQKGQTKIGTPGCDHKDDLTAIHGIGPKIEKVLNRLGIKSWEQLATLKAAEVTMVDEKLVDFSGRIKRDEWVAQAKAIVRNGHQPLSRQTNKAKKKPKKSSKAKSTKKSWQQGKTKFGTPGSIHRDDLKVINGIGPVIERTLNRYGVKSWEQLATLKVKEVKTIDEELDFPGRITREQWVTQAKDLVKQFPEQNKRPTRRTFLKKAG